MNKWIVVSYTYICLLFNSKITKQCLTMTNNDVILDPPPPHPFIYFFRHDPLYLKIILLLLYRILILDKKIYNTKKICIALMPQP